MSTGFIKKLDPPHSFPFVTNPRAVLNRPIPFSELSAPDISGNFLTRFNSQRFFTPTDIADSTLWIDMKDPTIFYDNNTKIRDKSNKKYTVVHSSGSFKTTDLDGFRYLNASISTEDWSEGYVQVHNFILRPTFTAIFVVYGNKEEFWYLEHTDTSIYGITSYIKTTFYDIMRVPNGGYGLRDKEYANDMDLFGYAPKDDTLFILIAGYNLGNTISPYRLNGQARESEESEFSNGQQPLNNNPISNVLRIAGWGPHGFLAEFIWFDRSLSTQECEKLEGYLAEKWNIQSELPSTHRYKTKGPDI
jgi:hypothetical protein